MNVSEQGSLTARLLATRRKSLELLERADRDAVVNAGGWRVKDVVVHLTVWETEILRSIEACLQGSAYLIPHFVDGDAFNREVFERGYDDTFADSLTAWSAVRRRTLEVLGDLSESDLEGEVVCPWDGRESLRELAESISAHEAHHLAVAERVTLSR